MRYYMVYIIQHSVDGFGHQLHGLFTLLIHHNINDIYYDAVAFIRKTFIYQHIGKKEQANATLYLQEIAKQFAILNEQSPIRYKCITHAHELKKIPTPPSDDTLYTIDSSFFFNSDGFVKEIGRIKENIDRFAPLFINDKLPPNSLKENEIVLHIRLGDAMFTPRKGAIVRHVSNLTKIIPILKNKYPDYSYRIHSDGDVSIVTTELDKYEMRYILFPKKTPILNVLSDFIYAKIFICGCSSLSTVCTFLGNKTLSIVDDNIKHDYISDNTVRITDYIESMH